MKKKDEHDFEYLLNWVEGRISAAEAKKFAAQLETAASDTQALVSWLREFQRLNQKYLLVTPPDDLDEQLYSIFTRHSGAKQHSRFFQRLLATLSFDSYQHLTAAGVRGPAAASLERHLVYSTDLAEVALDLQWNAREKSILVNGQIFLADDADEEIYVVELQRDITTVKMTPTDKLGKFAFASLTPGTYDMTLSGDQIEIALTSVDLHF
ncbi:MAG: hypothetical protein IAE79_08375 [Anaerolinea sp.]|nr:hypothetical protein [Anaerolinea sp.]